MEQLIGLVPFLHISLKLSCIKSMFFWKKYSQKSPEIIKWITRERPKIDRIACPWLIKNFVDREAVFIYALAEKVKTEAKKLKAIPFDVSDVEFSHHEDKCTFDYIIEKYKIKDPAVLSMAPIIRGADTDRHDLASQASGLWAISAGLA